MKLGRREYVFVAVLMAIPLAAWWFVFRPHNVQEQEMRRQLQAKQAKLADLNRATSTIGNLRRQIDSLEEGIRFFQDKLPSEKEIDKVLQEVWRLAEQNQLVTKSIRTPKRARSSQSSMTVTSAHEQPIEMKLEGDFMGFYRFLQALERQPRIMRIHKMDLEKMTGKDVPEGQIQASFVVSVFFEPSLES